MNRLDALVPAFRARLQDALDEMASDDQLHALSVRAIIVNETKRELAVQMAYRIRGAYSEIVKGLPELGEQLPTVETAIKAALVPMVQAYYKAAGLYAIGPTEAITPNTWTLDSKHLRGEAADVVPSRDGTIPWWAAPDTVWERIGELAERHGLRWGGRWKTRDCPHIELP